MRKSMVGCLGLMGVVIACGGSDFSSPIQCTGAACADGGSDAFVEGGDQDVVVPTNCDLTKDIAESPACVDDGIGVFVSASAGSDNNLGTKAMPFKTVGHAIQKAGAKPRIYICEGTYSEDVSLTQQNAVSLYGGLACADWTVNGVKATIGKSSTALHLDSLTKPIVIADLMFQGADGANPGESSVAALVNGSADVSLRRVKLSAGSGKDGMNGAGALNWKTVAQSDPTIVGSNASGTGGGGTHACMLCTDTNNSTGGKGGGGTLAPTGGSDGAPNIMGKAPNDGVGGVSGCKAGDNGATASDAPLVKGAQAIGALGAMGWTPSAGENGKAGGQGQGGGGGGGGTSLQSGGGGGGGCGGCGGAGGMGGTGGGGSIALAVVASKVTLVASELLTKAGGKGGDAATGQPGQIGGFGGQAASPGCNGGNGGSGGAGAGGGGGAGGSAFGVVYSGMKPTVDDATIKKITLGQAGAKGAGTMGGSTDGVPGVANAVAMAP